MNEAERLVTASDQSGYGYKYRYGYKHSCGHGYRYGCRYRHKFSLVFLPKLDADCMKTHNILQVGIFRHEESFWNGPRA